MKFVKVIPNILTSLRILAAFALIFVKPIGMEFYIIYTVGGVSDVLDGVIARAANCSSEFGARLDSIADLSFNTIMILKIMPALIKRLPDLMWLWVAAILLIRIAAYIAAAIKYKRFASLHTYLNKATGFCVFLMPYALKLDSIFLWYAVLGCTVATVASAEELLIHCKQNEYNSSKKHFFSKENAH